MGDGLRADRALEVGAVLGEGPVWDDRSSSLLFVDIKGERVHRYEPETGAHTSFPTGAPVGAVVLGQDGGLLLALLDHFATCCADGTGIEAVGDFRSDATSVRFNDGKVDPWGRFVAGTMDWKEHDAVADGRRHSPRRLGDGLERARLVSRPKSVVLRRFGSTANRRVRGRS